MSVFFFVQECILDKNVINYNLPGRLLGLSHWSSLMACRSHLFLALPLGCTVLVSQKFPPCPKEFRFFEGMKYPDVLSYSFELCKCGVSEDGEMALADCMSALFNHSFIKPCEKIAINVQELLKTTKNLFLKFFWIINYIDKLKDQRLYFLFLHFKTCFNISKSVKKQYLIYCNKNISKSKYKSFIET